MSTSLLDNAKALPLAERIKLAEALWEDITQQGYEPLLTPAQASELDRRLEAHRRDPDDVVPVGFIKANVESKYGQTK